MMTGKGSERSSSGLLQIGDELLDYKEEKAIRHRQISIKAGSNNIVSTFISSFVCKHCGRKFTSGRGLGGHMRTHNPNFLSSIPIKTPSSSSTSSSSSSSDDDDDKRQLDFTRCLDNFSNSLEEENEYSMSLSDLPNRKSIISIRSDPSVEFEDFSAGVELDAKAASHPLNYKLRHNPKRSRRITDQEFNLFTSNSSNSISGDTAPLHAASSSSSSVARKLFHSDICNGSMSSSSPGPSKSPELVGRPCPVCTKEFSSWKALCGHMRCHPDRKWRGIQPPIAIDSKSKGLAKPTPTTRKLNLPSSTNLDAEWKVDLIKMQRQTEDKIQVAICNSKPAESESEGKPIDHSESDTSSAPKVELDGKCLVNSRFRSRITGKRSKRSRMHSIISLKKQKICSNRNSSEAAALVLLMLKCPRSSLELEESSAREEDWSSSSHCLLDQEKDDLSMTLFNHAGVLGENALCEEGDPRLISNQAKVLSSSSSLPGRNGSTRPIYQCTNCRKIFASHQALGGHRASHRKVKGCFARTVNTSEDPLESREEETMLITDRSIDRLLGKHGEDEEIMQKRVMLLIQQESLPPKSRSINQTNVTQNRLKGHKCSLCQRVFASGQALGGHMRCHWIANKLAAAKKESNGAEERPDSEVKSGTRQYSFLLDLNLPAPSDEEEGNILKAHTIASYTRQ